MKTRLCHEALNLYYSNQCKKFESLLSCLERAQRAKLQQILQSLQGTEFWRGINSESSYEDLIRKIPVRSYSDFESAIQDQKKAKSRPVLCDQVLRYEPTSGSTENRKWIPYNREFLNELNRAAAPWLGNIYQNYPEVKNGRHYWSLSWLPEDLRSLMSSDDADLFPFFQRWVLKNTMAVSQSLSTVSNPQAAWWGTLVQLASQEDLSLVSVWSPTFWLNVMKDIESRWETISQALESGRWLLYEDELNLKIGSAPMRKLEGLKPSSETFYLRLWPQLKLLSAWDSSSSRQWFEELKAKLPHIDFQGKGLWATEGVLTIPYQGKKVLAVNSHFYEFRDLETEQIYPSWKLELGKKYQPILWASSGLLRYALADQVEVVDFLNQAPCFEFLGRLQTVDMVGEKITADWVRNLIQAHPEWKILCLVACANPTPHYVLAHQSEHHIDVEAALSEVHHYQVARELGQLTSAQSLRIQEPGEFLSKLSKSAIAGQNKVEILKQIDSWPL